MKKFLKVIYAIIIICIVISYNVVQHVMEQKNELQDIFFENVEALASGETGNHICYGSGSVDCPDPDNPGKVEYVGSMRLAEFE